MEIDQTAAAQADPNETARAAMTGTDGSDAPAVGAAKTEADATEGSGIDLDIEVGDAKPDADDTDEIEVAGTKYKVPKAVKPLVMMHEDYTRKTMTLAEERKAVAAEKEAVAQVRAADEAEFTASVNLAALRQQAAQYEAIDWNGWSDTDPVEAMKADRQFTKVKEQIADLAGKLQGHQQWKAQTAERESATRRAATLAAAATKIPDWSPTKQQDLETFAVDFGYTKDTFAHATADDYALLNLAKLGAQYQAAKAAAAKQKTAQATQPAPEVGGNTPAGKPTNLMTDAEWEKWREADLQKKRRA